jgi:hypothetical protein
MKVSTISRHTGSEGPAHDPYHFEEIEVVRQDGRWVKAHLGLSTWVKTSEGLTGGAPLTRHPSSSEQHAMSYVAYTFERVAGISLPTAARVVMNAPVRAWRAHAKRCDGREVRTESGYPGETFFVCGKCGDVIESHFDRSAVE